MKKNVIGIDIGGGSIRCALFCGKELVTLVRRDVKGGISAIGDYGFGMDTGLIWQAVRESIAECVRRAGVSEIAAIGVSSMRHTLVALDKDGEALFASPNRDARAVDATMRLNDTCADLIYSICGHKPMPNLTACKLLWLKDTQRDLYDKIATVFTLSDYIIYRLCGKIGVERTQAGETLLFDLKNSAWSDELIEKLELNKAFLPPLVDCASEAGTVFPDLCKELNIKEGARAVYGAGDTQSALLGMNIVNPGECGIVAGTTMPIQLITEKPIIDPKQRLWSGVGPVPGVYVLESNAGGSGMALEWIAGLLYQGLPNPVGALMENAAAAPCGAGGLLSTVGASVFNVSVLALPIDQIYFSTTNHIPNEFDRSNISRGVVEGLAFGVKANIDQLAEVAGAEPEKIAIGGGASKDDIFPYIISQVTEKEIIRTALPEASVLGAAICAAAGAGIYKGLKEAAAEMVGVKDKFAGKEETYRRIYEEWREAYASSFETNMPLGALISELKSAEGEKKSGTQKAKLRIYSDADLSAEAIDLLRAYGEVTAKNYRDGDMLEGEEMISTLKNYDIFITEVDIVDADIVKALPNLRMIGVCRGNPTNIDVDACSAAGIAVVYTPGRNSEAVADLALAFMLNLARMIPQAAAFLKEEGGQAGDMGRMGAAYFRYQGMELWRKKVGLIGGGAIGKKVAKRLLAFGAQVLVYDPYLTFGAAALMGARKAELDELLSESDIISLHAPVTGQTKGMINAEAFAKMKDGAYFVNTARAALVDSAALLDALKSGKLAGAALDVFDVEPPAYNDPLVQMENVLCTPHIGGNTKQVSIHQGLIIAENIERLLKGELSSDVINRKALKDFSFTGERKVDIQALAGLKAKQTGVSDLDAASAKQEVKVSQKPETAPQKARDTAATPAGAGGYMQLIEAFLKELSADEEVGQKTASKDISFQITFKDNGQSCYMYFKGGEVICGLGEFTGGAADVCLNMPIEIFDGMMKGTVNGAKAAMTGKMSFTGNVRKAMSMQSLLKLMMTSYGKAMASTGITDVSALSQAPIIAPQADTVKKEEARPVVERQAKKQGFFARLFGKKTEEKRETVEQKIIYAQPEAAKVGDVRDEILQVTNELYAKGLITGIGGNVSARCEDNPNHVWITPSSIFKGDLKADMMVRIDLDGNVVGESSLSASSEKMVHLAIYKKRPEIMAVIHSHAPAATLMALTNLSFKPVSTDAAFIGEVPVVDFVIPGSPELGDMVADALGAEGAAALMQNHGLVVCGNSVRRAADTTEVLEITAHKILECHKLGIQPVLLPKEAQEELASIGKMLV
jgi:L-ribulose-5-phosphate 4-epimerase